jgi:hypothetical protein
MSTILPLFTSINSIYISDPDIVGLVQQNEYSELVVPILASARVLIAESVHKKIKMQSLIFSYNSRDDWFGNWLYNQREDGKPRVLILHAFDNKFPVSSLIEHLKQVKL